jgi:hypothetical protein
MLSGTSIVTDAALNWNPNPPEFNWSVPINTNQAPTFTNNPGTQNTAEGASVNLQLQASDADGDGLSFGAVGLPPGLSISTSGLISGTVDYAAHEDGGGSYTVTAVVADGHGNSAKENFSWTVTDTPQPLQLANPGNQVDAQGDSPWFDLSGTDLDGNPLTYSATGLPPGVTVDPDTGLISGQVSPTAANGSPYTVTATVSDGNMAHNVSQTFTWTVNHLGLTNPGNQANVNGDAVSLQLQANDVDGDILTYGVDPNHPLPPGLRLTSTGLITGTLGPNADMNIPYNVMVTAGDGIMGHTVNQTFTWTVAHLGLTNPGNQANADNDTIPTNQPLQLQGHDADGDPLTYSASLSNPLPPTLSISSSGAITGTFNANDDARSPYTVTVMASDGHGNSASQTFSWSVFAHVTMDNPNSRSNADNDVVYLPISASDPEDGDPLIYSASTMHPLPPGLMLDSTTGLIKGQLAGNADVGSPYTVTITATDTNGNYSASQMFTWTVAPVGLVNPGTQYNADGDTLVCRQSSIDG